MNENPEESRDPGDNESTAPPNEQVAVDAVVKSPRNSPLTVVGIGASAGGLDALKDFFRHVPESPGVAFVVVVHLSPEHQSLMAELLQRDCKLPVSQVTETVAIEPNSVYVIPPNANLNRVDTHLHLSQLEAKQPGRSTIDHFFRTLAEAEDARPIGVILSGTGSDGTLGLRHIKGAGGMTIVQSPDEAEYDGMPRSAIESGIVDFVRPVAEIPELILTAANLELKVRIPTDGQSLEDGDSRQLQKVLALVKSRTGEDFSKYKENTVMRRIARRMQLHQIETLDGYLRRLSEIPDEAKALAEDMVIVVTEFFRDHAVFEALKKTYIPGLFADKGKDDQLRVWSVGCATGEEAYSLAILLIEAAEKRDLQVPIQVFASDVHAGSLQRARDGIYPMEIADGVSEDRLRRFFTRDGDNFRITPEVRECVTFAHHNLLSDPPFSRLDMVVCRNVLIYLQRSVQREVLSLFHYALKPSGLLVLGTSESADPSSDLFTTEDKAMHILRRRNVASRGRGMVSLPLAPSSRSGDVRLEAASAERPNYGSLHESVVERYAPPSVLVNDSYEVVHYSASAGEFLRVPGGGPTNNIFRLLPEPLNIELRAALHASQQGHPMLEAPARVVIDGETRLIALRVRAIDDEELKGHFLVMFDEIRAPSEPDTDSGDSDSPQKIARLEAELEASRNRMQSVIEEYELAQEEMRSANEELQSANEELHSTMEELETSKEELQSMNEELGTVNQENRQRMEELSQLSSDLQNLLTATDIATLFLDRELRIVRFTPHLAELFNVRNTDRGRPVTDLTHRLGYSGVADDAAQVLSKLVPIEREVAVGDGQFFMLRILPYRTTDDRIDGAVITLFDITRLKTAENEMRNLSESLGRQVAERTQTLEVLNNRLRQLISELSGAEHAERQRIAKVLHDHLQQLLIGTHMRIKAAQIAGDKEELADSLESAAGLLTDAINEARSLTVELRPPALYEAGFIAALHWLKDWFEETHGLKVQMNLDPEAEPGLADGSILLYEAVRELLLNVVKHAGVKASTVNLERAGEHMLSIAVSDAGRGLDHAGVETRSRSTGLGLTHITERLKLMGGAMTIKSRSGHTTVTLIAPFGEGIPALSEVVPGDPPGAVSAPVKRPAGEGGVIKVLLVDDHEVVRQGIGAIINGTKDMTVVGEAADGSTAIDLTQTMNPDVVVMDVNLPDMSGIAVTRSISKQAPHVRIVGLSIHNDSGTTNAMLDAGAVAYVTKDDDPNALLRAIRNAAKGTEAPPMN